MGSERNLSAVAPVLLTANGGTEGQVHLTSTLGFFVKQQAVIQTSAGNPLNVEIKYVVSDTFLLVGPPNSTNMQHRTDVSAYTVAAGSFLFAVSQPKALIPMETRLLASYIQEPSNSWRVTPVDSFGDSFDSTNPLPVSFEGGVSIANVGIIGPAPDNNQLNVNADGSINEINLAQLIPFEFNEIDLTNSTIGGQVVPTTVVYKQIGTTVATLVLTYDGSANLLTVVRS